MSNRSTSSTFSRRAALKAAGTAVAGMWAPSRIAAAASPVQPALTRVSKPLHVAPENSLDPAVHSRAENLFWTDAMMEHAGFFAALMPGADLADQRAQAENFQRSFQTQFERAKSTRLDRTNYADFNRSTVELMKPFIDYKRRMLDAQNSGKIRTLVFSTFFDHTAREAERAAARLEQLSLGDVAFSFVEVIDFWSGVMSDHSELTAHMLDPQEQDLIGQARDLAARFQGIGEANRVVGVPSAQTALVTEEMINFQAQLDNGLDTGLIKSIIQPTFADHLRREMLKFLDELNRCKRRT
jgi:hypothetical protein